MRGVGLQETTRWKVEVTATKFKNRKAAGSDILNLIRLKLGKNHDAPGTASKDLQEKLSRLERCETTQNKFIHWNKTQWPHNGVNIRY